MPRLLVMTDDTERDVILDEPVDPEQLGSGDMADRLIVRLAWSIEDAAAAEAVPGRTRSEQTEKQLSLPKR
jgi:hypothetical protein